MKITSRIHHLLASISLLPMKATPEISPALKFQVSAIPLLFAAFLCASSAWAATDSWTGATGGDWSLSTNWSIARPGAVDTALFNTNLATVANAVADQSVNSISFDTAVGTPSGTFTIGTTGGNKLVLGNLGTVQILSTLAGSGKSISINSPITLAPGSGSTAGTYTFSNNSSDATNTLNFGGPISAGTTTSTETLILSGTNTGNNTISGAISNGGAAGGLAINKLGAGTWVLSGANTFTGGLTLTGGTLVGTGNARALGNGALTLNGGSLLLTNASGSNLRFNNNTTVAAPATITSDVAASGAGNTYTLGTLTISGAQKLSIQKGGSVSSGTAGVAFGATTLSAHGAAFDVGSGANLTLGAIGGAFNFTKQGAGTLTLAGNSTRSSGLTYLNAGTILQTNATGLGTTGIALYINSGTLDLASDTTTNAYNVTLTGSAFFLSDRATNGAAVTHTLGTLTSFGANTLTIDKGSNATLTGTPTVAFGAAVLNANASTTFAVNTGTALNFTSTLYNAGYNAIFNGAGNTTASGVISGGGGLTYSGTGTLTLNGANAYGGATSISSGNVVLGNATGLGVAATANVAMTGTSTLSTNAFNQSVLAISGTSGTVLQNNSATAQTFTVTPGANQTSAFAGTVQNGSTGSLALTVNGTGALSLGGTNTYSGGTTLTAGQLNINSNNAIGTGAVTLTAGILDNTSGSDVSLATTNAIAVAASNKMTFGGTGNLNLGAGTMSAAGNITFNLMGTSGKTLTVQNLSETGAGLNNYFYALPGSNSTLSIGAYNLQATGTANTTYLVGNANIAVTGGIVPTITAAGLAYNRSGTLTLSGTSTYTGLTALNGGSFILDASGGTATLPSGNALSLGGGTFI